MSDFDAVVVGAGAVGLACGYALARRGLSIVVTERGALIGSAASRNSEVVHAGFIIPPARSRRACAWPGGARFMRSRKPITSPSIAAASL